MNTDLKFFCSQCGQHLEAPEEMSGTWVDCPSCRQRIKVPQPNSQPVSAAKETAVPPLLRFDQVKQAVPRLQSDNRCCGYGGWLRLFYVLHVFVIPIIALPVLACGIFNEWRDRMCPVLCAMMCIVLWGLYAGIKVRLAWPGAARTAKQYLTIVLLCAVAFAVVLAAYSAKSAAVIFFAVNAALIAVCLGYFYFSKRVQTLPINETLGATFLAAHKHRLWRIVREMGRMACVAVGWMIPSYVMSCLANRELYWDGILTILMTAVATVGVGALAYSLVEGTIAVTKRKNKLFHLTLVSGSAVLALAIFLGVFGWTCDILDEQGRQRDLLGIHAQIMVVYVISALIARYNRNRAKKISSEL